MPLEPPISCDRQDQRVDTGIERSTTKGHAQIDARCLPESKNLVDGPNSLCPWLTICWLPNVSNTQLGELLKNLPRMRTYTCLSVSDEIRLRTGETARLRRAKQALHPADMNHIRQSDRMLDRIPQHVLVHDAAPTRVFNTRRSTLGTPVADNINECTPSSSAGSWADHHPSSRW